MELSQVNTCTNCQNLDLDFNCSKHGKQVDLNNVCDSHVSEKSLSVKSSCLDCSFFNQKDCKYPSINHQMLSGIFIKVDICPPTAPPIIPNNNKGISSGKR